MKNKIIKIGKKIEMIFKTKVDIQTSLYNRYYDLKDVAVSYTVDDDIIEIQTFNLPIHLQRHRELLEYCAIEEIEKQISENNIHAEAEYLAYQMED